MFDYLRHIWRVWRSRRREMAKLEKRSPQWRTVEKHFRAANPKCAACGGRADLQVHHVEPFHSHPEKELDPTNLIGLCMGRYECHIRIGHGDSFHYYNPHVREDAATVLKDPDARKATESKAKAGRKINEPGGS